MSYGYTPLQWVLVFFAYCFLGWCFESAVVSTQQRRWVNRGFLHGPMLPIYGFGATLLLHISLPLERYPAALFLASMAAATVFEYAVGAAMEKLFRVKYWDYSSHRFQLHGRICLQSSLCWGFLGLILTRLIHRPVDAAVTLLPTAAAAVLAAVIGALFAADVCRSVRAALDLAKLLEELDELREQGAALRRALSETALVRLTRLSYRVDEARGEWSEKLEDAREELSEKLGDAREEIGGRVDDAREQIHARLDALQQRFDERAAALDRRRKSLLRGNPSARSARYDDVLQRLKRRIDAGRKG